jgi:acetoin utilization deacetylase AcuC-like enzyme
MGGLRKLIKKFGRKGFPFKFIYSENYWMVGLEDHVFPLDKYRRIYESLFRMGAKKENFITPGPAADQDILLVHSPKYINKMKNGKLSQSEILNLELPYGPEILDWFALHAGGSIMGAEKALDDGLAVHIGGGFHHAFSDHGEGFCVLNDVAVALEKQKAVGKIQKAMIVDCDVHQGNGTAEIFSRKDYVFTFSIHQMDLYPAQKSSSTVDVGLWSGDGDEKYISALNSHFPRLYTEFQPDLIFYLAGADPFKRDQLGGLDLTFGGLMERDKIVMGEARNLKIPVVILLAGGYAPDVTDTVNIHLNTIRVARTII